MNFKYLLIGGVLLVAALGTFFFLSSQNSQPQQVNQGSQSQTQAITQQRSQTNIEPVATVEVLMVKDRFEPETLEIRKDTKVIFKNQDTVARWPASNLHPTHGIYPEFDPQEPVNPGSEWSFVFDKAGSWRYHDHLMPSIRGIIVVTE